MHKHTLKILLLFLYIEMVATDVSSFVRILSFVYVRFWIPIRLNYLRLRIKLRPVMRIACELSAFSFLVLSTVPMGLLFGIGTIVTESAKLWMRLACLLIELSLSVEPGTLYNKTTMFIEEESAEANGVERNDHEYDEEEACKENSDTGSINEPVKYLPSNEGFNDADEDGICID